MKKQIIAAGIGIIALTATGCALPSIEAKVESTPAPATPATATPKEQYIEYVSDQGVYVGGGHAYEVGLLVCDNFDSMGYRATVETMISANNQYGNASVETSDLAAMAVGASMHLCPEHENGFRAFAASN